ncbi:MAG: hypothetical protein KKG64_03015 [Firmicutes bacterium]|nr:hypothetical protein [Bacillota bacterium]
MLSTLINICLYAFWISLIGGTLTLFGFRLYFVFRNHLDIKKALFVLLTPCSIGFYQTIKEHNPFTGIYRILVVLFFISTLLGSVLILYMHLELDII